MKTLTLGLVCVLTVGALCTGCFSDSKRSRAFVVPPATAAGAANANGAANTNSAAPTQGRLTGTITRDGASVEQAFLVVASKDDGLVPESIDPGQLFTGLGGEFAIDLPPGDYEVTAVDGAGAKATSSVSLGAGGATLDLDLTVDPRAVEDLIRQGPPNEASEEASEEAR